MHPTQVHGLYLDADSPSMVLQYTVLPLWWALTAQCKLNSFSAI